ncbi:putative gustatory receptor 28b [Phlebotomus papatasi]|uniref:putative gustatory receptor 28b n=1 Tax=Phlebotomus papatasi TaxID=29031 RepID=UPI0024835DEE|nr:putative gustatory receptor 28b [Phlebotomus papatasi]
MLSIISISFMTIVFSTFYVLSMVFQSNTLKTTTVGKVEFIIFFTYQICICLLGISHIGHRTNSVIEKNIETPIHVFKLIYNVKDPECKEKLKIFSDSLLHVKIQFTAYDLFKLDKTIIVTVRK